MIYLEHCQTQQEHLRYQPNAVGKLQIVIASWTIEFSFAGTRMPFNHASSQDSNIWYPMNDSFTY